MVRGRGRERTGERKILTTDLWESVAPIYTPDGKRIVFQSQIGGYVSAVWVMNSDGSHPRRLTAPALKGAASAISPDGKHILLIHNLNSPPALPNENFVMNLNGSGLKRLAPLASFHHDLGQPTRRMGIGFRSTPTDFRPTSPSLLMGRLTLSR